MTPLPGSGAACTRAGCRLGGDIEINNTAGTIVSEDVTATGFSPSVGPFTQNLGIFTNGALVEVDIADSIGDDLHLEFATPTPDSLVGYTGGSLSAHTNICCVAIDGIWYLTSGALTAQAPASVPEPSSLALLLSAVAGLGALLGGRRLARRAAPG